MPISGEMARIGHFAAAAGLATLVVGSGVVASRSRAQTVLLAHGIPRDAIRAPLVAFDLPPYIAAPRPRGLHLRPRVVHPRTIVVVRRIVTPPPAPVTAPAPRPPAAPKVALAPRITGRPAAGQSLAASAGRFAHARHAVLTRTWLRCDGAGGACNAIPDAAGASLPLGTADVGHTIRIAVTATVAGRSATGLSAPTAVVAPPPAAPVATTAPTILGFPASGSELTADPGVWTPADATVALQWQRCDDQGCVAIDGETGATYDVVQADVGFSIRVEVTATDAVGVTTADSAAVAITS
jgi:hypothetical protein